MATKRRIGLRDIRNLTPGQVIWDASVSGFGARRQKGAAVSYMVFYRTQEGRQRWHTIGRTARPGRLKRLGKRPGASSVTLQGGKILQPSNDLSASRLWRSFATCTWPMRRLAAC
jgi:hypothetical protein